MAYIARTGSTISIFCVMARNPGHFRKEIEHSRHILSGDKIRSSFKGREDKERHYHLMDRSLEVVGP